MPVITDTLAEEILNSSVYWVEDLKTSSRSTQALLTLTTSHSWVHHCLESLDSWLSAPSVPFLSTWRAMLRLSFPAVLCPSAVNTYCMLALHEPSYMQLGPYLLFKLVLGQIWKVSYFRWQLYCFGWLAGKSWIFCCWENWKQNIQLKTVHCLILDQFWQNSAAVESRFVKNCNLHCHSDSPLTGSFSMAMAAKVHSYCSLETHPPNDGKTWET